MSQALLQHVQKNSNSLKKKLVTPRTGDRVRIHQRILETTKDGVKERIQIFEGLVIASNSGHGTDATFTVRKISNGVGVEKIFPLHSSNISKIEIQGHSKVSRSKLYFMRERTGKSARLKDVKGAILPVEEIEEELSEEILEEAVKAAEEAEAAEAESSVESREASDSETSETSSESTPEVTEDSAPEVDSEADKKSE